MKGNTNAQPKVSAGITSATFDITTILNSNQLIEFITVLSGNTDACKYWQFDSPLNLTTEDIVYLNFDNFDSVLSQVTGQTVDSGINGNFTYYKSYDGDNGASMVPQWVNRVALGNSSVNQTYEASLCKLSIFLKKTVTQVA